MTAIQVLAETVGDAGAAAAGEAVPEGAGVAEVVVRVGWSVVMGVSSRLAEAGCIRRMISIIWEKAEALSGSA